MVIIQKDHCKKINHCEKYDIIEDNPENLEATNQAAVALNIRDENFEVNLEVEMEVEEIDEDDTEVGEE